MDKNQNPGKDFFFQEQLLTIEEQYMSAFNLSFPL